MKRRSLKPYDGKRLRFEGKVATFSQRSRYKGSPKTVLIEGIRLHKNQEPVAHHIWLSAGKWSRGLKPGDRITFDAKVRSYERNYWGKKDDRYDYKLAYPSNIRSN